MLILYQHTTYSSSSSLEGKSECFGTLEALGVSSASSVGFMAKLVLFAVLLSIKRIALLAETEKKI